MAMAEGLTLGKMGVFLYYLNVYRYLDKNVNKPNRDFVSYAIFQNLPSLHV